MLLSKKGQIPAQIFIYVVAIILFSFILIYGYNAVRGFKERSEQIAYIRFKTDLISTVNRISSDYGTLKREEFFIGGDYRKVCFVQNHEPPPDLADNILDPIMKNSVGANVDKNVFLFADTLQESFDVGEINVSSGYLCIEIKNGKARIEFEGRGDHTYISEYTISG